MELSLFAQGLLVGIAFCAGLISAIAGSGGLLTLPALLWCGLPPMTALATNKVQSALGTLTSTFNFFRNGHLNVRSMLPSVTMGIVGSIVGTFTVQAINGAILTKLMPLLLLAISLYFLFSRKVTVSDQPPLITSGWFAATAGLSMGIYGGFFGPGMGSIMPFLLVWLLGHNLIKATAETKLMILAINGTSAIIFAFSGYVLWSLALSMAVAQMLGAQLGSSLVMTRGTALVQPFITIVTLIVALKLLFIP